MISHSEERGTGDLTLAFDLAAVKRLANPRGVFVDAREWSRYVGIVADDPEAAAVFIRRYRLSQDFEYRDFDRVSALSKLKWEANTNRYVFVGTNQLDRELADHVGWEFIPLEEAASSAGWRLAEEASFLDIIRNRLVSILLRPR